MLDPIRKALSLDGLYDDVMLSLAVERVKDRHPHWCGSLERWVELVYDEKSTIEANTEMKGAGLL